MLISDAGDLVSDLRDIRACAVAEYPGLPVVLLGHSMGGIVATRFAQLYPDELMALVLSGPVIGDTPLRALLALDPIPEIPIDPEMLSRDPRVGAAYAEDPLVWHGAFKRPTLEAMFAEIDKIAAGPGLDLPVLWMHGEEDPLAPLDATTEAIDRSGGDLVERRIYPGARHEVFNETNSGEVLADVARFLRAVVPRERPVGARSFTRHAR